MLPSFTYLADLEEFSQGVKLPWEKDSSTIITGAWARTLGSKIPTKCIQSAKSWLSTVSGQRKEKILPLDAMNPQRRLSPVEVSSLYLAHIKSAWNESFPKDLLEDQEVVLTVPASFDEVARLLTVEAARSIGIKQLTLLEEPQAAFYCWLSEHEKGGLSAFKKDDVILVCDVGAAPQIFL